MNPKILTELERQKIHAYLKRNGEKDLHIRQVVFNARKQLPTIKADVELIDKLLAAYEKAKRKG
ncbi:MAG: hypothetical protein ABSA81_03055 [Candidatus Bathyarchaeia archaeon]|jgi:hypothetical protein